MGRAVDPRAARRLLRREIFRRSRLYLLPAALLAAFGVTAAARGLAWLSFDHYDGAQAMDGTLRQLLVFIAFAVAIALVRSSDGSRELLRRLPADPAAALHARLQLAAVLGTLVLAAFLLTELLAQPVMMHPSFPGRLNPAETETLRRLPGVPLLRFTVDGEVTRGLASELSVAAIRPAPDGENQVSNYGETSRWSHFDDRLARPGEVLATLDFEDWPRLHEDDTRQLRELGVPFGATVEIVLERYLPEDEYHTRPWRRDGLGRERRWHAFDRAVGFLGLLAFMICALSSYQTSPALALAAPMILAVLHRADFGPFDWRSALMFSDLTRNQPRFPTLDPRCTVLESLVFPLVIAAVCGAVYWVSARQLRLGPGRPTSGNEAPMDYLRRTWRAGIMPRVELIAILLFFALWFGSIGFELWGDARVLRQTAWMLAVFAVTGAVLWMTGRWARRDALLSRLPAPPADVARRRLAWMLAVFAGIALLPLAIEHVTPLDPRTLGLDGEPRFRGSAGWAKCLLIAASGYLIMAFSLLGRSTVGSWLGALLCLFLGLMTMPFLSLRENPSITVASLAVAVFGLPAIHRLLRRRVELGRAPELSELLG